MTFIHLRYQANVRIGVTAGKVLDVALLRTQVAFALILADESLDFGMGIAADFHQVSGE